MKNILNRLFPKNLSEQELKRRIMKKIAFMSGLTLVAILSVTVFGSTLGGMFAFISVHRNDKDKLMKPLPNPPIFSNIPTATKEENITINGFAEPGSTIKLFVNGPEAASVIADNEGLFTLLNIKLIKGNNTLFGKVIDGEGRESEPTNTVSIMYDTNKPKIEILSPKDGETIRNLDKSIIVKGKVDTKCDVKVNGRLAILGSDNTFSVLLGATEGKMEIKIEAIDEAGNKDEATIKVTYVKSGV